MSLRGLYFPRPSSASQWPVLTRGGCAWRQCPVGGRGVQWPAPWGLDGLQGAPLCIPGACSRREHWGDRERVAGEEVTWFPWLREVVWGWVPGRGRDPEGCDRREVRSQVWGKRNGGPWG